MRLRVHHWKLFALFRLGFPAAPVLIRTLTSLPTMTRRLILQKAHRHLPRPRERFRLRLLVGTRVQVFSLPARGAFHLSLSVLFLYRSPAVFSLGPWSALFQPEFHVLRPTRDASPRAVLTSPTGLSPSAARSPNTLRLCVRFITRGRRCGGASDAPSTPARQRPQSWHRVGLGCSLFAHHYWGNLFDFFSSGY